MQFCLFNAYILHNNFNDVNDKYMYKRELYISVTQTVTGPSWQMQGVISHQNLEVSERSGVRAPLLQGL